MQDILLSENGNLTFEDGDFAIGDATVQNQKAILLSHKGEFKASPEVGVGIIDIFLDEDKKSLLIETKRQFEYDGMTVNALTMDSDGIIDVDAPYKTQ